MIKILRTKGRSANSVLTIVTLSHLTQHLFVGISVLYPSIMVALNLSYSQLGLAVGVASVASGFLQLGMSLLSQYTPRRIILGLGNLSYSGAQFGIGFSRYFSQFFAANIVGGIGQATQHPLGVSIIFDKYHRKSVGGALGLHYGIGYLGNIIGPIMLSAIASALNWRYALYIMAILPAVTGAFLIFYLKGEKSAGKTQQPVSLYKNIKSSLQIKGAVAIIIAQALLAGGTGMGALVTYIPLFLANQIHLAVFNVGLFFSITMAGGVIGPVVIGRYSDKIGHLKSAIICAFAASAATYLFPVHTVSNLLLIVHLFIVGVSGFAITSLLQAHLSSIANSSQRDIILGIFFTIGFGLSSSWSIVMGFIIDLYGSFTPAFQLMAFLALAGTFLLIWKGRTSANV